ncbi:MAG: hypothetical protein NT169_22345 [Chloroflexi bacterium]|nr:hypothetical protein [Chloroflexota bacterium]
MFRSTRIRPWLARGLIAAVFLWNVQCAVAFLAAPATYAPGFELTGPAGAATVRGLGVLFLMWNVPYFSALLDPARCRVSLYEAIAMQAIGFVGESVILWTLPVAHPVARAAVTRFIAFDGSGLILLLVAAWVTRGTRNLVSSD